jgi:hypothetical protein
MKTLLIKVCALAVIAVLSVIGSLDFLTGPWQHQRR